MRMTMVKNRFLAAIQEDAFSKNFAISLATNVGCLTSPKRNFSLISLHLSKSGPVPPLHPSFLDDSKLENVAEARGANNLMFYTLRTTTGGLRLAPCATKRNDKLRSWVYESS